MQAAAREAVDMDVSRLDHLGVVGRIVDEAGAPLAGLVVAATDERYARRPLVLGEGRTGADGRFALRDDSVRARRTFARRPNLRVSVFDRRGIRLLAQTRLFVGDREPVRAIPPFVIPRREAEGWLATLGRATPMRVSAGNAILATIDNEDAFEAILAAIGEARRSIDITQLFLDPTVRFEHIHRARRDDGQLLPALRDAAARGVSIRLALNENLVVPDHVDEVRAFFGATRNATAPFDVSVVAARRNPAVMHQKMVIVDDERAFLPGSPFERRYWDTREHRAQEPRRGDRQPHHDCTLEARGPMLEHLRAEFARIWRTSGGASALPRRAPAPGPGEEAPGEASGLAGPFLAQLLLTTPTLGGEAGEASIREGIERALVEAREHVYFENQYFTSEAIARAIDRALRASEELEVIMLLNEHMDIPTYDRTQRKRIYALQEEHADRFAAFSCWSSGCIDGRDVLRAIYIHSKATLADDACAIVGSANLDGVSLMGARELGASRARNEELAVLVPDGVEGAPRIGFVERLRRDLWGEMLGLDPDARELTERPAGGWRALWRRIASANERLARAGSCDIRGHVLPFGCEIPKDLRYAEPWMRP